MSSSDRIQLLFYLILLVGLTPLLGTYIANIYSGKQTFANRIFGGFEQLCYRVGGVNYHNEMTWKAYGLNLLVFNAFGFFTLFLLQLLQGYLPLNPQNFTAVSWSSAFNTAISFTSNTSWQGYAGETTMSYLTQMLGLTSQSFLSGATGMTVFLALARGVAGKSIETIGNFWVDLVRTVVYLFLPLSIILAIILVSQGVIQTFSPYIEVTTLESAKQTIPLGPAASQVAIMLLGSDGGGFFNANSSHPFENPTGLSNFLGMLAIILIPAATIYAYGNLVQSKKHALMLFCVMLALLAGGAAIAFHSEYEPNLLVDAYPRLEGKETRFGVTNSLIWSMTTTGTSDGAVNAMLSSLSPLAGGVAMFNIMLGEVIFGGVGVGVCSMIMFTLLTVFLSGLMVGRTPEYLGKKIEKKEIQWISMAVLLPGALILIGAGISSVLPVALSSLSNAGPHGLTEILYAFTSAAGNNGSAFAGLNANTEYYNIFLGIIMLIGRIAIILPALAVAGLLSKKRISPQSAGTFSTDSILFAFLLIGVIILIGGLTFFPALSLGPIVEHLLQRRAF